jgi:F-box/leucine-rich repeat protein 10/11
MFNPVDIQNQSILARDAASVLNALASVATETGMYEGSQGLGLDRMDGYAGENSNSSLLGIQGSTIPQPLDGISNGINSGKKGRSKACDECRKSKVRSDCHFLL